MSNQTAMELRGNSMNKNGSTKTGHSAARPQNPGTLLNRLHRSCIGSCDQVAKWQKKHLEW